MKPNEQCRQLKPLTLVDPTTYKSAIDLLNIYRNATIRSAKVLADHKSELRSVKGELNLVNQDYRDFSRLLREQRQEAKQLKLPSQATALAKYQQLNTEFDSLKNKRDLFKSLSEIHKLRGFGSYGMQSNQLEPSNHLCQYFQVQIALFC